jgi:hypothetical protein
LKWIKRFSLRQSRRVRRLIWILVHAFDSSRLSSMS